MEKVTIRTLTENLSIFQQEALFQAVIALPFMLLFLLHLLLFFQLYFESTQVSPSKRSPTQS